MRCAQHCIRLFDLIVRQEMHSRKPQSTLAPTNEREVPEISISIMLPGSSITHGLLTFVVAK